PDGGTTDVTPFERAAVKYLRAVERAASDRLNRVRRNEALTEVLSELVMAGKPRPLTEADSALLTDSKLEDKPGEDDEEDTTVEGRVQAQRALLELQGSPTLSSTAVVTDLPSAGQPGSTQATSETGDQ